MKNSKLIEALNNCITHCNHCADACLDTDNIEMMVDCIRTDRACAEVCSATVKLLAMDSAFAKAMVEKCHEICEQCAEECGKAMTTNIAKIVQKHVETVLKPVETFLA